MRTSYYQMRLKYVTLCLLLFVAAPSLKAQSKAALTSNAYREVKQIISDDLRGTELYNDIELSVSKRMKNHLSKEAEQKLRQQLVVAKNRFRKGERTEAITDFNEILANNEKKCGSNLLIELYNELGQAYHLNQMDDLAFVYFIFAIEMSNKYKNPKGLMEASFGLSLMYFRKNEFKKAVRTSEIALEISDAHHKQESHRFENTLAMGLTQSKNPDRSLSLFQKAFAIASTNNDSLAMAKYASNISAFYSEIAPDLDSAYKYASISCDIFDLGIRTYTTTIAYNNLAIASIRRGDPYDFAYEKALLAEAEAVKINDWRNALFAVNTLTFIERRKENNTGIISLLSKSIRYKDSLIKLQNYEQHFREDLNLSLQEKFHALREKELLEQNEIRRKNASIMFWLIAASIGAIFLAITIFVLIKNNRKKQRIQKLEFEKEQVEKQYVQDKLTLKTREIASLALLNANIQKTLDIVKATLSKKKVSVAIQGEIEKEIVSIKNEINITKNFNARLEEFQFNYNQTNPEFVKALKAQAPTLSNGEIRHCMLLKNNMNSDEIANLLGVEKTTLRTARYRIHKKLGLDKGVKLQEYLLSQS